jgi:4-hydroxy-3-methylbut-2-en-1-yl diphosphate reductase
MEIKKADKLGLCFGVRRAVEMIKREAAKYGSIETLGPLVHNQQLLQKLIAVGITPVDCLEHVRGKTVAIPTHGVGPEMLSQLRARRINIINTTCPIVQEAQNAAKELAEAGFEVLVFGDVKHSEVKGLLGWTMGRGVVISDTKQIASLSTLLKAEGRNFQRLGVISQTTQTWPVFNSFVTQLVAVFSGCDQYSGEWPFKELRIINTLCRTTQEHRRAAIELAQKSQLIIVVGGYDSANTKHLVEICSPLVETHHVERAVEIEKLWITGKHYIGITAGASTPDETIRDVEDRLKSF